MIEFAELEEFIDLKLKNYSSGMHVRLAFAVMIQVDADILLIDEVLAVGDAAFQQKCYDEFDRLRDEGRTILLVTHDMDDGRALLRPRDAARARRDGRRSASPTRSRARTCEINFGHGSGRRRDRADRHPARRRAYSRRRLVRGRAAESAASRSPGRPCTSTCGSSSTSAIERPSFGVLRSDDEGTACSRPRPRREQEPAAASRRASTSSLGALRQLLAPGRYYVTPTSRAAARGRRGRPRTAPRCVV